MKKIYGFITMALLFGLVACSSSSDDDDGMMPDDNQALIEAQNYFNNTLRPIIVDKCFSCHEGKHNKNDGFNYTVFNNARNSASSMFNEVDAGTMPKDGDKLPQSEIDMFEEFRDLVNKIN